MLPPPWFDRTRLRRLGRPRTRIAVGLVLSAGVVVVLCAVVVVVGKQRRRRAHWPALESSLPAYRVEAAAQPHPPQLLQIPQGIRPVAVSFDGPPPPSAGPHISSEGPLADSPLLGLADAFPPIEVEPRPKNGLGDLSDYTASDRVASPHPAANGDNNNGLHSVLVERLPPLENEGPVLEPAEGRHATPPFPVRMPPIEESVEQPVEDFVGDPVEDSAEDSADTRPEAPANSPQVRQAMAAVNEQAEELIVQAMDLAHRRAYFAARHDLVGALRMITQALDARDQTRRYSQDLAAAWRALKEAKDFAPPGAGLEADLDLELIVDGHRTPLLKQADWRELTPLTALQQYLTYAQQKLVQAGGGQPSASFALYGLGRIAELLDGSKSYWAKGNDPLGRSKAIVFHQASLMVDQRNYLAANELGVLLGRYGQWKQAREVLAHSLSIRQHAAVWRNLAIVHQRLGEHDLAQQADGQSRRLAGSAQKRIGRKQKGPAVTWVSPKQFQR